ncbi:MAG: PQQ-binding-like beta-propeller repeat protein [Planctomycetota bacterium]|nr:PQQ-binding-like beta-propeller repeat protein [Planctomycetota bacterium]
MNCTFPALARIAFIFLLGSIGLAQEWTRFRGPNGSGLSGAKTIPVTWTDKDYNWIAELPGRGHSSPVLWGDKLFVTCCDEAASLRHLICLNTPNDRPAELIFSHCYEGIVGVDLTTGKQNWHIDVFGRDEQRSLVSPIIAGDLVIAGSGAAGGTRHVVAVKPAPSGASVAVNEAYHITRQAPHIPTPLAYGDWLFLWSDQGIATCFDRATGKTVWQQRIGGNFYSSPICIDGRIYCIDLDGVMVVIAAGDKYEELARISLGHPTSATPAVSNGTLFIRTESHVFSLGG